MQFNGGYEIKHGTATFRELSEQIFEFRQQFGDRKNSRFFHDMSSRGQHFCQRAKCIAINFTNSRGSPWIWSESPGAVWAQWILRCFSYPPEYIDVDPLTLHVDALFYVHLVHTQTWQCFKAFRRELPLVPKRFNIRIVLRWSLKY